MNTPHPLAIGSQIDYGDERLAPASPVFFRNPPLAREIQQAYTAEIFERLKATPPDLIYISNPAFARTVSNAPEAFSNNFDRWFAPETDLTTLCNATEIVYHTEHVEGIQRANREVIRRIQESNDLAELVKLSQAACWDPVNNCPRQQWSELVSPHLVKAIHRFPDEPAAVAKLLITSMLTIGHDETLELPSQILEILKAWLKSRHSNEIQTALAILAHTPERETDAYGECMLKKIEGKGRLYFLGDTAFRNNPAPWCQNAMAKLATEYSPYSEATELVCKYGGEELNEIHRAILKDFAKADAWNAVVRVSGKTEATTFVQDNLKSNPLPLIGLLLEQIGEEAIPICVEYLKRSNDDEGILTRAVAARIVARNLGKGNSELLSLLESTYRAGCKGGDFHMNVKLLLNALGRLGHPDVEELAKLLPQPDSFTNPLVVMTLNDATIDEFVTFLNQRLAAPIDKSLIATDLDFAPENPFFVQCSLHDALQQTSFAMELDWVDWLSDIPRLIETLVGLTDGEIVIDGIRVGEKLEISWKGSVFVDTFAPYSEQPGGVVDLMNAMLDQFGESDRRFVAYHNERGNEYPTIVFLPAADVEILKSKFGLVPLLLGE